MEQVTFSGHYARERGQKVLYVTERAVFRLGADGPELIEIAPGLDPVRDIAAAMGFRPAIAPELRIMDARLFADAPMDLAIDLARKPARPPAARLT